MRRAGLGICQAEWPSDAPAALYCLLQAVPLPGCSRQRSGTLACPAGLGFCSSARLCERLECWAQLQLRNVAAPSRQGCVPAERWLRRRCSAQGRRLVIPGSQCQTQPEGRAPRPQGSSGGQDARASHAQRQPHVPAHQHRHLPARGRCAGQHLLRQHQGARPACCRAAGLQLCHLDRVGQPVQQRQVSAHCVLQGVLQRYELNKKWYYLWGVTCFFAYLYLRPLIRRGIGSASRHAPANTGAGCPDHPLHTWPHEHQALHSSPPPAAAAAAAATGQTCSQRPWTAPPDLSLGPHQRSRCAAATSTSARSTSAGCAAPSSCTCPASSPWAWTSGRTCPSCSPCSCCRCWCACVTRLRAHSQRSCWNVWAGRWLHLAAKLCLLRVWPCAEHAQVTKRSASHLACAKALMVLHGSVCLQAGETALHRACPTD